MFHVHEASHKKGLQICRSLCSDTSTSVWTSSLKGVWVCVCGWVTLASFSWLSMLLTSLVSRRDLVSEEDKLADRDSISHWKDADTRKRSS